jgi:hypothetical protein
MAEDKPKITDVRIVPSSPMSEVLLADARLQAEVFVKYDGGKEEVLLFKYYDDEISFDASEFLGLTKEEGNKLHLDRDIAYLRS